MAAQQRLAAAASALVAATATASQSAGDINYCLCFEVSLKRWDGTAEMKRFVAQREVEFPELCERLVATFPGDLRMSRKGRDGRMIIKPNFEVVYTGHLCRRCNTYETACKDLVVFDTFGLRAALHNDFKSGCQVDWDELLVVKINCTVRDGLCTIL